MLVKARNLGHKVLLADGRTGTICGWGEPGKRGIRKASRRRAMASGSPHLLIDMGFILGGHATEWVPMDQIIEYV
ncbi:MAG TPA: hypothetical protein VMW24_24865 [Sedimentisphaerales bacterium]|nr:hypothetical protein [Sedimentisphaerales bacterium]